MTPVLAAASDRDPLSYRTGETMVFSFRAENAPRGSRIRWRRTGDDGEAATGELAPGGGASLATSLARPGFVRVEADLVGPGDAALAHFEGGAGADVAAIRADSPEPADFDAFWARRIEALADVPARGAAYREIGGGRAGVRLFEMSAPCPGDRPCTGILTVPEARGTFPAKLRLRGYEAGWSEIGRNSPPPDEQCADAVVLYLSAHGFAFNREPAYYAALRAASASRGCDFCFDPVQNADPGASYFAGIAWRVLRGLEILKSRPEWNGRDLVAFGGSLGGWQAIVAAALDGGVTECRPRIPWCCNMAGPASGRAHGDWFVPWVPALAYHDPVHFARRIPRTCRVEIPLAGLGDYVSPPSGVAAFYNALSCPKKATFVQGAMHFSLPPEPRQTSSLADP